MTTIADLRAMCPTCQCSKEVRLQGKTWRLVAHSRSVSHWSSSRTVACPVRCVDAGPLIEAWLAGVARTAAYHDAEAATFRARADAQDKRAADERSRHAALSGAFRGAK